MRGAAMQCPKCGGRAYVYATKPAGTLKQRYRQCRICGHRFSTWEEIEDRELRGYESSKKAPAPDLFETANTSKAS
ncbi:Ogr/Delta-like zinc finger [Sulfitobacter delicatus]|uniref:Ogr/Delta-like zinc finger n=2 Tax=Sulfitobacter delicatus TaxID=218672 RepID=A0A1G7S5N9_9RHOB|nr:Ogr/Delta-like zinc finger [Sulfitobacter delicatus]